MTTVSGVPLQQLYGYGVQSPTGTRQSTPAESAQAAKTSAVDGVLATLENGASTPLTYNSSGLLASSALQGGAVTSQTAQDAVYAAENAVTDTLNSLLSGSSSSQSNSSALDIPALLGSPGIPGTGTANGITAQAAQDTLTSVQNAITDTLGSLGTTSASGSSG